MAKLTIGGKKVTVDDSFLSMSADEQNAAVEEIASSLGVSAQPSQQNPPQDQNWSDLPGNIGPSVGNAASGLWNAVTHPSQTANAIGSVAKGGMQNVNDYVYSKLPDYVSGPLKSLDSAMGAYNPTAGVTPEDQQMADAFGGMMKDRYGGAENIKRTMINDPFGAALDVSSLFTGGAGVLSKVPMAGNAAKVLSKVGEFTNPINAVVKPIGKYTSWGDAPIPGQSWATTQLLKKSLPKDAAKRMKELGKEGMLMDVSPSMTGLAQGSVTTPGPAKDMLVEALLNRQKGQSNRLIKETESQIGKARDPEALKALLRKQAKRESAPFYNQAKMNAPNLGSDQALQNTLAVQLTDPAKGMTEAARAQNLKWMNSIEDAMKADTPQDTVSRLHGLRQELDTITNPGPTASTAEKNAARMAQNARKVVDDLLKNRVPGFAEGDAAFAKRMKQKDAVDFGYNALEGGKSAVFPESFNKQAAKMDFRFLKEGVKSRIANAMGTQSNDLLALKKLVGGENDFNRAKMQTVFGKNKTDALTSLIDRESLFSQNFADVSRNSQTAQRLAAEKLLNTKPGIQIEQGATLTGIGGRTAAKTFNYLVSKAAGKISKETTETISKALAAKGDEAVNIIAQLGANRKVPTKDIILIRALLAGRSAEAAKATQQQFP